MGVMPDFAEHAVRELQETVTALRARAQRARGEAAARTAEADALTAQADQAEGVAAALETFRPQETRPRSRAGVETRRKS